MTSGNESVNCSEQFVKKTDSVKRKGREPCELLSTPKVDEIESGMMYCIHVCVVVFCDKTRYMCYEYH